MAGSYRISGSEGTPYQREIGERLVRLNDSKPWPTSDFVETTTNAI